MDIFQKSDRKPFGLGTVIQGWKDSVDGCGSWCKAFKSRWFRAVVGVLAVTPGMQGVAVVMGAATLAAEAGLVNFRVKSNPQQEALLNSFMSKFMLWFKVFAQEVSTTLTQNHSPEILAQKINVLRAKMCSIIMHYSVTSDGLDMESMTARQQSIEELFNSIDKELIKAATIAGLSQTTQNIAFNAALLSPLISQSTVKTIPCTVLSTNKNIVINPNVTIPKDGQIITIPKDPKPATPVINPDDDDDAPNLAPAGSGFKFGLGSIAAALLIGWAVWPSKKKSST